VFALRTDRLVNKRTPVPDADKAAPFPPQLILKPGEKPYQ
jgi:hypothetical protein